MTGMVPEDVYELTWASEPRLSPDGRTVAYCVKSIDREANDYRSAIWVAAVDGSRPPRQFTAGTKRDGAPRWSPDGARLAFTSTREKDEAQLYVIPATGGEPVRLTDLAGGVDDPSWSPDGTRILFSCRLPDPDEEEKDERKRRPRRLTHLRFKLDNEGWIIGRRPHLFVVTAEGTDEPVQLTHGDHEDGHAAWSPDGSRIAFASARHEDWDIVPAQDIYLVKADGGDPEILTGTDGWCDLPSWSPDGSRIAFHYVAGILDDPRHTQIAVVDVDSGRRWILTESLDRKCAPYPDAREPIWVGNDDLLFGIEDRGNVHLYRVPADGSGPPERVVGGDRVIVGYDVAGGRVVHAATTSTALSELFEGDRPLTDVGRFGTGREVVEPEAFAVTSTDGSTEIDAWIIRPAGFEPGRKYPVILHVHGGPYTQYGNRFLDEFHVYAGAGYVVLYCNPRGSSGYSEAFARAIRGPASDRSGWGSVDKDDCLAVVEEAVRRYDFCDGDRVCVMGGSYGGFLTTWLVAHTDRFKAAISERAVNQWVSMWGSSDFGWDLKGYTGTYLFEDMKGYLRMSPATYAPSITTPMLILHSENDLRCPIEQGEQVFTTLRLLKRDVEMVRFPGEGHELTRSGSPVHRVQRFEIVLDWLSRKL